MTTKEKTLSDRYYALVARFGYMISGEDLWRLLAYRSLDAFRKAQTAKTVPVPTFRIEGRRTRFARTEDVAVWIDQQMAKAQASDGTGADEQPPRLNAGR